ncbi:hypothetical protein [Candidatus Tokpelaia sp.]|uniref:hypothetical protein n=1 Tax=Candidatus Tokpelaia sp. TaxID=2233777 RepID=UPI00123B347E|nr:hypothetical protein [Candidatus Tokpelaia sp.]KAA6405132.1 hypothetical protein DPQ22_06155 [Candidatus Tokpelaia sp.]
MDEACRNDADLFRWRYGQRVEEIWKQNGKNPQKIAAKLILPNEFANAPLRLPVWHKIAIVARNLKNIQHKQGDRIQAPVGDENREANITSSSLWLLF